MRSERQEYLEIPLSPGSSRGIVGRNIGEMMASGHPQKQAVAAALSNARKHPNGGITGMAEGGQTSWTEDASLARHIGAGTTGFLHSVVPGRTDMIHAQPPVGSYVVPADVVSGIGEGNSLAGASLLQSAMATGPWGTALPRGQSGARPIPKPPPRFTEPLMGPAAKRGGRTDPSPTPILAAGGEFIVPPDIVEAWGGGDLKRGHDALDHWVVRTRRKIADEMKKLPGPKKR